MRYYLLLAATLVYSTAAAPVKSNMMETRSPEPVAVGLHPGVAHLQKNSTSNRYAGYLRWISKCCKLR
jgi:hypothetical protein